MPYGTVNADVIGTSVAGSNIGAGNASIMKNRIINGAMVIDQRNAGASVTATGSNYSLDRWQMIVTASSKFTVQQNAGSVTPPVGYKNYLGATSSAATSLGATDYYVITQKIEGYNTADLAWGTANAKTVTVSFQVYSSLTGTFGFVLRNASGNRVYPASYSVPVANTWTSISVTIAGDTTGTWSTDNSIGIELDFCLGVGSTYSNTAGTWTTGGIGVTGATSVVGTNGATWYVTGVQLEVGSSATGFEYRIYGTELANCQRYYEKSYNMGSVAGAALGQGWVGFTTTVAAAGEGSGIQFKVSKRASPTVTYYNAISGASGSAYRVSDAANVTASSGYIGENATGNIAVTPNANGYYIHFTATAEL